MIEILSGLLTPVIAIIATYIAYQQWKLNKQKLMLEKYDRRLKIYEEVKKVLILITRDAEISHKNLLEFNISVSEADFLFRHEISDYLQEIYKRGLNLHRWNRKYKDNTQIKPEGYNHDEVVDGMDFELTWLTEQFNPAKEKFKKYLDISK
ncbi:hypothetical protein [Aliivibrio sifiae]|uniref:DUF4760 domain-containing protein n=1 Tax=Aliivibrio sifiae TaxID=566293 RepID=A0A2S7X832_9GAMM|nr:hypothetical protein [Aliivibrio sifiae]PQJ87523.1 hypothetical protein BTO23_15570 [Aliivibrio sifiae]GLR77121.1 hypothetical protein GCM10007855_39960 [Aliivibrio sifiae]